MQVQSAEDTILAMPGTVQGQSGWYEFEHEGELMAVKYDVQVDADADADEWVQAEGPLTKLQYNELIGLRWV